MTETVVLSANELSVKLKLSDEEKQSLIHGIEDVIEKSGEVILNPSYLNGKGFGISVSSDFFEKEDQSISKNTLRIHLGFKGRLVEDASILLLIIRSGKDIEIGGYYNNSTRGKDVVVKGLMDILGPFDELVCQATSDHYQLPVIRIVGHGNSSLIQKFKDRGFAHQYNPGDLSSSTKVYQPN